MSTSATATRTELHVDGRWTAASDGARLAIEDPATGQVLTDVADATPDDGLAALSAACAAFTSFKALAPRKRGEILSRAFEAMVGRQEELATLLTLEMGKPIAESRGEVAYAASYLRWYAEEAVRIRGRFGSAEDGMSRILTMQQPVGPCLFITPWNFPLAMGARKVAPAIAAGCTCVVKPAAQTPLSMLAFADVLQRAGLPDGVVNVVPTSRPLGVTAPLISDPRLRKLSFTGSTAVGRRLVAQASEQLLRVSMELGGNAPFLVFEDADLDRAVDGAVVAKMRNMGQACTGANRFLVHEAVAEEFGVRLAARMQDLATGHGLDPSTDVGPLIDAAARDSVHDAVSQAVRAGARVLTGGEPAGGVGYFYAPTVLVDVPSDARLLHAEIFGPVAPIVTFTGEAQAVETANATEYGLAAYLFTRDVGRAFRISEALETGMVGLNQGTVSNAGAPFGGVKHSGYGREGGAEGLQEYLNTKYVAIAPDA